MQILSGIDRKLKTGALWALVLIVIGLCAGILSSPLDRDPVAILSSFFAFSFGAGTWVRSLSLLVVLFILLYLALLVYTARLDTVVKICCALGGASGLVLLGYLALHSSQTASSISGQYLLFGGALTINSCVFGVCLACFSLSFSGEQPAAGHLLRFACGAVLLVNTLMVAAFAVFFWISSGGSSPESVSSSPIQFIAWAIILLMGIGGSIWGARHLLAPPQEKGDRDSRLITITCLCSSFLTNIAFQILIA